MQLNKVNDDNTTFCNRQGKNATSFVFAYDNSGSVEISIVKNIFP